jgi:dTDP-4-amino-4,6-dideoxygalactose transaminase
MMKVPFLDLNAQIRGIRPELDAAIARVIDKAAFINGPVLKEFETAFAAACGVRHAVGASSGTTAIHLAMLALGIREGDEVIVPVNTFIATAEPVFQCGAKPVLVDVDPDTALIDPKKVERAITKKTKAIIAVHLFGQIAPMQALKELSRKHSLKLIEDSAQAHLASQGGFFAGALGDCGCFSFFPGKNLGAFGDAGMVVTNEPHLAEQVAMLRDHGRKDKYLHQAIGFNERMDAIQAAILQVKLKYLESWNAARREKAKIYHDAFEPLGLPIKQVSGNISIYHLYVIKAPKRDTLRKVLEENGIASGIHYPVPLHLQPALAGLGFKKGDFPVAESLAETILSLPIFPEMTMQQQQHVIDTVKNFLSKTVVVPY